jgi:hypothetical protein
MENHAIAPWRLDNPMPFWMRLTDPRNLPVYPMKPKKNYQYAIIEPDGHTEYFNDYSDICQHYAISTRALARAMKRGSLILERGIYQFQSLTKEAKK